MVDYTVHYENNEFNFEDRMCFGSLSEEYDRNEDWGELEEGEMVTHISYHHVHGSGVVFDERKAWLENHPLFKIPLIAVDHYTVEVDTDYPADLMMATLSMSRFLFDESRRQRRQYLKDYLDYTGNMDLAVYMCDFQNDGQMLKYVEESLSCPFTIKEFIDFVKNPLCNGTGIENNYTDNRTYDSVKTALMGKRLDLNEYITETISPVQLLEILKYEHVF